MFGVTIALWRATLRTQILASLRTCRSASSIEYSETPSNPPIVQLRQCSVVCHSAAKAELTLTDIKPSLGSATATGSPGAEPW